MQNKGAIRLLAILLALVSVYQLSFTFIARNVESKAETFAQGDPVAERAYLDSVWGETVYNFLWLETLPIKIVKRERLTLVLTLKVE